VPLLEAPAAGSCSDAEAVAAVTSAMMSYGCRFGWVLDSFPRSAAQASLLEAAGCVPSSVLELQLGPEESLARKVSADRPPAHGEQAVLCHESCPHRSPY